MILLIDLLLQNIYIEAWSVQTMSGIFHRREIFYEARVQTDYNMEKWGEWRAFGRGHLRCDTICQYINSNLMTWCVDMGQITGLKKGIKQLLKFRLY